MLDPRREALSRYEVRSPQDIERAFQLSEVDDPLFFFGRDDAVRQAVGILSTPGRDGVIFGERGIGKSSVGRFMMRVARGHLGALDYYGGRERLQRPTRGFFGLRNGVDAISYNAVWVAGGELDAIGALYDKLAREVTALFAPGDRRRAFHVALGAQAHGFGGSVKVGVDREGYDRPPLPPGRLGFEATLAAYRQTEPDKDLVVFVDEFDQVAGAEQIALQLKNQPRVRFVLIGIASSLDALVSRHLSIARQLVPIELDPMTEEELEELVDGLCLALSDLVVMAPAERRRLALVADGSPFVCKALLHELVTESVAGLSDFSARGDAVPITGERLGAVLDRVQEVGAFPLYERLYQQAIEADPTDGAAVLQALAARCTADAESVARDLGADFPVAGVERYLRWLVEEGPRGQFAKLPSVRSGDRYAFADPVFRRYARLRTRPAR